MASVLARALWRSLLVASCRSAPAAIRLRRRLFTTAPGGTVHVVGDSHVAMFSGTSEMVPAWPRRSVDRLDRYRTYRLGSVLAYRLPDCGTTSGGRERLFSLLAFGSIPPGATIMMCFGEIDCRLHLPRLIDRSGRDRDDVVAECVNRYASVVREVLRLGFRVLVWGVVPALEQTQEDACEEYPCWGTAGERNRVIEAFNTLLAHELEPDGIPVITLWDELVSDHSAEARRDLYMDSVHLSAAAVELANQKIGLALSGDASPRESRNRLRAG